MLRIGGGGDSGPWVALINISEPTPPPPPPPPPPRGAVLRILHFELLKSELLIPV